MKQVENYKTKYVPRSFSETKDSPDSYWKCPQKKSQSFPVSRNSRNPETVASYYSTTTYKPQRSHVCSSPTYSKFASPHGPETTHHVATSHCKPTRDKHHPSSYSTIRKTRCGDELGNNEKLKYISEESENFTEDNVEEDADEEEDEHEEAAEFLDKDYEGQEGDDETEEEYVASHQMQRNQRTNKNDALLKQQRWRTIEQDPRRLRYQQRMGLNMAGHTSPTRCYHNPAEQVAEPLSEEEFVLTSPKYQTRRSPVDYYQWFHSKNNPDRYNDSLPIQSTRRARTKPTMDQIMEAEFGRMRRCNRCGSLSNRKGESLPKSSGCRFEDRANIPIKEPVGDEPESLEKAFCGRCSLRHSTKDANDPNDAVSSLYSTKSRKSRDTKSPVMYEIPEQSQIDKLPNDYLRSPSRYQRKTVEAYPEKLNHLLRGTGRVSARYVE